MKSKLGDAAYLGGYLLYHSSSLDTSPDLVNHSLSLNFYDANGDFLITKIIPTLPSIFDSVKNDFLHLRGERIYAYTMKDDVINAITFACGVQLVA